MSAPSEEAARAAFLAEVAAIVRARKGISLGSNREDWTRIFVQDGEFFLEFGDVMTKDRIVSRLTPEELWSRIRGRLRDLRGFYGRDEGEVSDAELLADLREGRG